MYICIETDRDGWATRWETTVQDNEKLVQALLRTVKRYRAEEEGRPETAPAEEAPEGPPAAAPEELQQKTPAAAAGTKEPEPGYRGFLLMECGKCGRLKGFNAKEPVTENTCRDCGHVTVLKDVVRADLYCPVCKKTWRYKTNTTQPDLSCACINCGTRMRSRWNKRLRCYLPVTEKEGLEEDRRE